MLNIISGIHDGEPVASLWVDAKNEIRSIAHVMPHKGVGAANAHLIAASPDLYAACVTALEILTDVERYGEYADNPLPVMLRAALRKAEGR